MNRMTDHDKNFGPFTIAPWRDWIEAVISSGDDEDSECYVRFIAFGWALRIQIPNIIKPFACKYEVAHGQWGFRLTKGGGSSDSYDFFTLMYGPQTMNSETTRSWHKHLPWTQWDCVRHSLCNTDGTLFTEWRAAGKKRRLHNPEYAESWDAREKQPSQSFLFDDYDGERITATVTIEEREWHKGEGWFRWLRFFTKPMIRRSLDIKFSDEVGPEKGSWKGGTMGTGCTMQLSDTAESAFRRFCDEDHRARGDRKYKITFVGEAET